MTEHPWRQFFDRFAPQYDDQVFTQNTKAEIEFILEQALTPPGGDILDLGCGTGRHAVALAARGFCVTAVDISGGMLALARQRAQAAGVDIDFVQADAAAFSRPGAFDTALCLCEGAFCLLCDTDDALRRDETIVRNLAVSLRSGGTLILNALSALRAVRAATDRCIDTGRFDPLTMTELSDVRELLPNVAPSATLRERYYTAPEIRRMAEDAHLTVRGIHGGTAGNWGLRPVELEDYELMLIASK